MQKQLARLGFLFVVGSSFAGLAYEDQMMSSYQNPFLYEGAVPKTLGDALRMGFMRAIPGGASRTIGRALDGTVSRINSLARLCKKSILCGIYGNRGFDIRELCTLSDVIKNNAATVLNFAKGARVVRAHVLTEQGDSKAADQQQVFQSIVAFKQSMQYVVMKLNECEPYYSVQPDKNSRSWLDCTLDAAAAAGMVYVVGDAFVHKSTEQEMAGDYAQWQKVLLAQQRVLHVQNRLAVSIDTAAQLVVKKAEADFSNEIAARMKRSVAELAQVNNAADQTIFLIKTSLCIFAAVRLVQWLRSKDAIKAANALGDVNRDLIVHLVGSMRNNLNYLISLCDGVKQESDLVRIKDDIEFISKNCGDSLVQIAYLIDQEEALNVQRLSKPGQSASQFGQGAGGLGSMLSKI